MSSPGNACISVCIHSYMGKCVCTRECMPMCVWRVCVCVFVFELPVERAYINIMLVRNAVISSAPPSIRLGGWKLQSTSISHYGVWIKNDLEDDPHQYLCDLEQEGVFSTLFADGSGIVCCLSVYPLAGGRLFVNGYRWMSTHLALPYLHIIPHGNANICK